PGPRRWNNYPQSSFYVVLVNKAVGYLAGDTADRDLNFACGQTARVPLPPEPRFPTYTLLGLKEEVVLPRAEDQHELRVAQASLPGNYRVVGRDGATTGAFSVNVAPEESQLAKVPAEQIEGLFGPETVLPLGHQVSLPDVLQTHWKEPVE